MRPSFAARRLSSTAIAAGVLLLGVSLGGTVAVDHTLIAATTATTAATTAAATATVTATGATPATGGRSRVVADFGHHGDGDHGGRDGGHHGGREL